jgi:serine/threonine-protein phosphatase 2A activator
VAVPDLFRRPTAEVSTYLINAVGDRSRIDYGTGHEAHFVAWMYAHVPPPSPLQVPR